MMLPILLSDFSDTQGTMMPNNVKSSTKTLGSILTDYLADKYWLNTNKPYKTRLCDSTHFAVSTKEMAFMSIT